MMCCQSVYEPSVQAFAKERGLVKNATSEAYVATVQAAPAVYKEDPKEWNNGCDKRTCMSKYGNQTNLL